MSGEKLLLVRTLYSHGGSWSEWKREGADPLTAVVDEVAKKVMDGKASSLGMEVIEVTVNRRVRVAPQIHAVDITEDCEDAS